METESIRYAGSKLKLVKPIIDLIPKDVEVVLDGCSGSTRVGQALKQNNYKVISNDIAPYSYILGLCYIKNNKPQKYFEDMIEELNNLKPRSGWFTKYYGGKSNDGSAIQSDGKKRLLQKHNTRKTDSIREAIDSIDNEIDKAVALTSLMIALDKVTNDLGHQVAYLKDWSKRSFNTMQLQVPKLIISKKKHKIIQKDIFSIKDKIDLAYIDPPYGTSNLKTKTSRVRYASYYHFWSSLVLNDKPELYGVANRRSDTSDSYPGAISIFESTDLDTVKKAFIDLINKLNSRYILFSYNNKSKIPIKDLIDLCKANSEVIDIAKISHQESAMKHMSTEKKYIREDHEKNNNEYLILIKNKG